MKTSTNKENYKAKYENKRKEIYKTEQKNQAKTHIGDQRKERCICWRQRSSTRGECSTRACARKKVGDDVFF